jgi:hypothetical protein
LGRWKYELLSNPAQPERPSRGVKLSSIISKEKFGYCLIYTGRERLTLDPDPRIDVLL